MTVFLNRNTVNYILSSGWNHVQPTIKRTETFNKRTCKATKITLLDDNGRPIKYYNSASEAGKDLKLDSSMIIKVARGIFKQYKGYRFALTGKELTIKM